MVVVLYTGLNDNKVAVGLVVGLEYEDPTFDTHDAFQAWKTTPFVSKFLKGGKLVEYGAKTLPEGGYFSIPKLYTDHALIVGDGAGLVAMPSLKGIHLSIESGMLAAKTAAEALSKKRFFGKCAEPVRIIGEGQFDLQGYVSGS